jgi:hypothetical protein
MIRFLLTGLVGMAVASVVTATAAQGAYDAYGYNYAERKFTGLYEDADRDATNNTGDETRLQMEWSDGIDLAHPELSPAGSWVTNFQKGTYLGSNGVVYRWSYSVKLVYSGPGSPIWGYFIKVQESYVDAGGSPTPQSQPPILPQPGP